MESRIVIALVCLVVLSCFNGAQALSCYSCIACTEPFTSAASSAASKVTCNAGESCYKISATALGVTAVSKGCLASCSAGTISVLSVSSTTTCCTTDNCNSAPQTRQLSFGLAILVAIISVFFCFNKY